MFINIRRNRKLLTTSHIVPGIKTYLQQNFKDCLQTKSEYCTKFYNVLPASYKLPAVPVFKIN